MYIIRTALKYPSKKDFATLYRCSKVFGFYILFISHSFRYRHAQISLRQQYAHVLQSEVYFVQILQFVNLNR